MIPHPNTIMCYLCMAAVPIHATVGGTANWISVGVGFGMSCAWGMTASFDAQMYDRRKCSQMTMLVCPMQAFLVQSKILKTHKIIPNHIHLGILAVYFVYHAARYSTLKHRREI